MTAATLASRFNLDQRLVKAWPLLLGFLIMSVPTVIRLGEQIWSRESGAHGPIILGTGIWLLWRNLAGMDRPATGGAPWLTILLLVPSLAIYIFGGAYDFISLEVAGLYGAGIAVLHSLMGVRTLLRIWFPVLYLGFCVPPPMWILDTITAPLKEFVSYAATSLLELFDLPINREGVTIFVGQYQLLVEDACSGMNSLVGLVAISLLYIYLLRGSRPAQAMILTAFVIPIAVAANILRIITLILLTHFYGDAVAQGFLHFTAGIFLFGVALILVFATERLISAVMDRPRAAK